MLIIVTEKKKDLLIFITPRAIELSLFSVCWLCFFFFDFFLCEKSIFWLQKKKEKLRRSITHKIVTF